MLVFSYKDKDKDKKFKYNKVNIISILKYIIKKILTCCNARYNNCLLLFNVLLSTAFGGGGFNEWFIAEDIPLPGTCQFQC